MGIWDKNKKRKISPFEASLVLDTDDVKIVEARYDDKPIFVGIGIAKKQAKGIKAGGSLIPPSAGGAHEYEREYEWKLYCNPNNMPGFLPMDKVETLASSAVAITSGSPHALQAQMEPMPEKGSGSRLVISDEGVKSEKEVFDVGVTESLESERELMRYLESRDYQAIVNVAVDKSMDIVAWKYYPGFGPYNLGIQIKFTKDDRLSIAKKSIDTFITYALKGGFEPILAIRFGKEWRVWRGGNPPVDEYAEDSDLEQTLNLSEKSGSCIFSVSDERGKRLEEAF